MARAGAGADNAYEQWRGKPGGIPRHRRVVCGLHGGNRNTLVPVLERTLRGVGRGAGLFSGGVPRKKEGDRVTARRFQPRPRNSSISFKIPSRISNNSRRASVMASLGNNFWGATASSPACDLCK